MSRLLSNITRDWVSKTCIPHPPVFGNMTAPAFHFPP